ncbi:RNA methyltransferase [Bacillus carboniphilus]|uniref:RNA methyltransferase n=1 Tax=Bacillus carboniphilus TaxID=86663 RepID=A0ABP3G245_9BACI
MKWIQSVQNEKVKEWKKLLQKKGRDHTNQYIVEGFHLVEEACQNPSVVQAIMVRQDIDLPDWAPPSIDTYQISPEVAKAISDTETNQGIFAICSKVEPSISKGAKSYLLLDAVQDPGNLGTIIRTADAAGVDVIILGEGTADVYNPKVLRSAQGSHFHVPIMKGNLSEWISKLQSQGVTVYGSSLQGAKPYQSVKPQSPFALILGNEGNGVDPSVLEKTNENLYVPIYGKSESLNVTIAGGILLYHLVHAVHEE